MLKFLGKTIIVSAAIVAIPIVMLKRIKKLDEEGFFDDKKVENKTKEPDRFPRFNNFN
jgi:hypothetical protein